MVTYASIFCKQRILHAAICGTFECIFEDIIAPTLVLRLADYNLNEQVEGVVFGLSPIAFVIGTFLAPCLIPEWVPNRVILFIALILASICTLLTGPFFAPKNLTSMLVGLFFSGFP